ncbi:hypothetical protein [Methanimicrococcus hacksteinii]|uniref:hypothetical protein n=1 Tax=Methanimicrococcus hacksteinii TaxID=3028293 RepID=UPI00298ED53D|nr:hypothetical protein [Methanimicrococcus sp. At1]
MAQLFEKRRQQERQSSKQGGQCTIVHHLILITSARCASVGTDYLTDSVCTDYAVSVNTVADLPACPCRVCRRELHGHQNKSKRGDVLIEIKEK